MPGHSALVPDCLGKLFRKCCIHLGTGSSCQSAFNLLIASVCFPFLQYCDILISEGKAPEPFITFVPSIH